MNKKDECAIFQDLYELYREEEVEDETKQWMMEHETTCADCQKNRKVSEGNLSLHEDSEKIWGIRIMTMSLYSIFFFLAIWMSIWYLW
ncbi:hypothetical protein BKP45_08235 [Anaerobacillus alkalidiazotrophicus]|uniref:Zinc-finger domain-containing protein n=1 Tax=Anaerobacillus alkalidiazotrophicus TaxID=472963 RepID=A0A1S2MAD1_9BACI|nr:hypothetical protein [Anaerobacillus alkalidiazotrophicus]OIJ20777.1 hypothetical protein BKP45_08235 [Anaerobacillus alkalidiazotrophicus]